MLYAEILSLIFQEVAMKKYAVEYKLQVPMGGVRLTGGRFQRVFENNVAFLKGFDLDCMLY